VKYANCRRSSGRLTAQTDLGSNAFEVFNGNRSGISFQGFIHDPVSHIPEQPFDRSLVFARQPFQKPPLVAALVPCGLKITALRESSLSNVFDDSAFKNLAGIGCGDADDTRIDADYAFACRIRDFFGGDQVQIPQSAFARNGGGRFDLPRPIEILPSCRQHISPELLVGKRGLRSAKPPRNAKFLCRIESGSLLWRNL
jgi:hypothetical protein